MTTALVTNTVLASLVGVLIAAFVSLIPGLHIYNVIAITMLITFSAVDLFVGVDPLVLTGFMLGMVVGFSVLFTVSSQYFQPSDESFRAIVLPHEKLLLEGRGHEAVMLGGVGALVALFAITIGLPILSRPLAGLIKLIQPHHYWILATVIVFILMTEWPKDHGTGRTPAERLQDGWVQLLMGYFTFFASGLLGLFVFYKTLIPIENAFQSLMPLFVGLFAMPSYLMTFITRTRVPRQFIPADLELRPIDIFKGSCSGLLAGSFAAVNPGMTPGPALLLAGHATVTSGEKQFIIGGGAGRLMYYVGALLLFFLPGVFMRRGGAAINISLFFVPETPEQFFVVTGVIALAGGITLLFLPTFSRICATLVRHFEYRLFSALGMVILIGLVVAITSWQGLLIMLVATALGVVPNFWHTRRINLLAVLLIPIFLNMAGIGPAIARWLGIF